MTKLGIRGLMRTITIWMELVPTSMAARIRSPPDRVTTEIEGLLRDEEGIALQEHRVICPPEYGRSFPVVRLQRGFSQTREARLM